MKKLITAIFILKIAILLFSCTTPKQYTASGEFPQTGRIVSVKLNDSSTVEFVGKEGIFLQRNWIGPEKQLTKMDTLGILELIEYWGQYNDYLMKNYDMKNYPKDKYIIAGYRKNEGLLLIDINNVASMNIK